MKITFPANFICHFNKTCFICCRQDEKRETVISTSQDNNVHVNGSYTKMSHEDNLNLSPQQQPRVDPMNGDQDTPAVTLEYSTDDMNDSKNKVHVLHCIKS